ncbi:hypothetical protein LINGRAHAP2_LOCUS24725 [Linum grandiflorum]
MLMPWMALFLSFACLLLADGKAAISSAANYHRFCHQTVPESPPTVLPMNFSRGEDRDPHFDIAYFTGGTQIFPGKSTADSDGISLSFHPKRRTIYLTENPNVLKLQATLRFHLPPRGYSMWHRNLRQIRFRGPRIPVRTKTVGFDFYGFWSRNIGQLCMVGSDSSLANSRDATSAPSSAVVLKLKYPVIAGGAGNVSSLIRGSLESTNPPGSFELEYASECSGNANGSKCNPLKVDSQVLPGFMTIQGRRDFSSGMDGNLRLELQEPSICLSQLYQYARSFELEYASECSGNANGSKCNPLKVDSQVLPGFMTIQVGDCSIQFSLRFPKKLTIQHRSTVVGQISSSRSVNDSGYFPPIGFHGFGNKVRGLPGLEYKYTVLDMVAKSCAGKKITKGKGTYPSAYSFDMRFDMSVSNSKGQKAEAEKVPTGDHISDFVIGCINSTILGTTSSLMLVSFLMAFCSHR